MCAAAPISQFFEMFLRDFIMGYKTKHNAEVLMLMTYMEEPGTFVPGKNFETVSIVFLTWSVKNYCLFHHLENYSF